MTGFVGAIHMGVTRSSALVAMSDYIVGNAFSSAFVEHKVFPNKLIFQILIFYLSGIFNYTSFELVNIFKPFVLKVSTCLLYTSPSPRD